MAELSNEEQQVEVNQQASYKAIATKTRWLWLWGELIAARLLVVDKADT